MRKSGSCFRAGTYFWIGALLIPFTALAETTPAFPPSPLPYQEEAPYEQTPPEDELVSPKDGWGELEVVEEESDSLPFFVEFLLWPVNRILDLTDVVRVDVGAGTSYGGVLRLTRQGSLGYRSVSPGSVRIGSFGRKPPFLFEKEDEYGAGKQYHFSADREVCDAEFGVGLDLFVAGYIGVCFEGVVDLLGGVLFLDPDNDDIR